MTNAVPLKILKEIYCTDWERGRKAERKIYKFTLGPVLWQSMPSHSLWCWYSPISTFSNSSVLLLNPVSSEWSFYSMLSIHERERSSVWWESRENGPSAWAPVTYNPGDPNEVSCPWLCSCLILAVNQQMKDLSLSLCPVPSHTSAFRTNKWMNNF